jgi:hypothetical protein
VTALPVKQNIRKYGWQASSPLLSRSALRHQGGRRKHDRSAKYPDMPQSAIDSGCIDYILSPEAIADTIIRLARGGSGDTHGRAEA